MIDDAYFNPAFHLQGKRCYLLNLLLLSENGIQKILADQAAAYCWRYVPGETPFSELPASPWYAIKLNFRWYTYGDPWPGCNEFINLSRRRTK